MKPTSTDPEGTGPDIGALVSEAARDAWERDEKYSRPQARERTAWTRWALIGVLPILLAAAVWNVRFASARVSPPPAVEALDLARTLRVAVAEVNAFALRAGRLPDPGEAAAFLPERASLVVTSVEEGSWTLVSPAPELGELRYESREDPDAWLASVRAALGVEPGA